MRSRLPVGFNVIGHLSSAVGLGAAARNTLGVLAGRGFDLACVDMDPGIELGTEPLGVPCTRLQTLSELPFAVNLFHQNPPELLRGLLMWRKSLSLNLAPHLNAIVPFWELPRLPPEWAAYVRSMDFVLAPSMYIAETVKESIPERNRPMVLHYVQSVRPPRDTQANRARWFGDRADTVVFLQTFDVCSEPERKNPWATATAFQQAFRGREDVTLMLKAGNLNSSGNSESARRLRDLAAADRRIVVLDQRLSRPDLWELYASADAFVSLHRAEGLGLGPMEAMAVGRPVIATGWSGNMDFMTPDNSFPVPYRLVPVSLVTSSNYVNETHQLWAEPDVDACASVMVQLADSPGLRHEVGNRAARTIERLSAEQRKGAVFYQLLDGYEAGIVDDPMHGARVRHLYRYADRLRWRPQEVQASAKRQVVSLLRAVHLKPPAPPGETPARPTYAEA